MSGPGLRRVRHVEVDPAAPVSTWPYEALVAILERGSIRDWVVLANEFRRDPWGPVARQVEDYLHEPQEQRETDLTALLQRAISRARQRAEQAERDAVAALDLSSWSGHSVGHPDTPYGASLRPGQRARRRLKVQDMPRGRPPAPRGRATARAVAGQCRLEAPSHHDSVPRHLLLRDPQPIRGHVGGVTAAQDRAARMH